MYENLKLKMLIKSIANSSMLSDEGKTLLCIDIFNNHSSDKHEQIKEWMREFAPEIWQEFQYEEARNSLETFIEKETTLSTSTDCDSILDFIKKMK